MAPSTTCTGGFFGTECFLGVSATSWFELAVAVLLFAAFSFIVGKIDPDKNIMPPHIRLHVMIVPFLVFGAWGMSTGLRTLAFYKAGYIEGYTLLIPPLLAVAGYFTASLLAKAYIGVSRSVAKRRSGKSTP